MSIVNEVSEEKTISLSLCDRSGALSVTGTLDLFMDMATLHEEVLGYGPIVMEKMGLYWIIGKNRIEFLRRPTLTERVLMRTWPLTPTRLFGNREYVIEDKDGNVLVKGETEWLVANEGCTKLMPIKGYYPSELECKDEKLFEEKMRKVQKDFSDGYCAGTYLVRPTDIDFVGHMNNAAYARAVMSFIPNRELEEKKLKGAEFFYGLQCKENDELTVMRRDKDHEIEFGTFMPDGRNVMTARILFE